MLVVDHVPLAGHDGTEVVVLGDQDRPSSASSTLIPAHHVVDVIDVREDVAGGDDVRRAVLGEDLLGELLAEELLVGVAGDLLACAVGSTPTLRQ
jgi:hypothetical protein